MASLAAVVIGRHFAWAHLPKTGGDATYSMLCAVPGLVEFADPLNSSLKHTPFPDRGKQVAGKLLVMNIRRLPEWVISIAQHKARHGVYPDYEAIPLPSHAELSQTTEADDLLRQMTGDGRFGVQRWLRTERLEDDVLDLLDELGELTDQSREAVLAVGEVNVGDYDRQLERLGAVEVKRLYSLNPSWAASERRAYGSLAIA